MPGTRDAVARIGGNTRGLDRALGRSKKRVKSWARSVGRSLRGALRSVGTVTGFAGVAGFAFAAKNMLSFEKRLTRLGIQATKSAPQMAKLRKEIFDVSKTSGVDAGDLLSGVEKFVSLTGEFDKASGSLETFAKVAAASGANMDDIANTAAAMSKNLGLGADEMEKGFSILLTQGKAGAIELKDNARILSGIAPVFSQFGNKGTKSLAEMGAVLQIIRTGFNTSEEAATGLQALMGSMVKNANKFKKIGVDVFEIGPSGEKRLRVFSDIVEDLIKKSKGDPEVLLKVLGRKESYRSLLRLMKDTRTETNRLIDLGIKSNAVQEDSAAFLNSNAGKIEKSMAMLKATLNETLVEHVSDITAAIEGIGKALSFAVKTGGEFFRMFSDQGGVSDVEIGMLTLRESLGLVPEGTVRKRLETDRRKKAGIKDTDLVPLPGGGTAEARVAEELGFTLIRPPAVKPTKARPGSGRALPFADPFAPAPISTLERAAADADAQAAGVEIGEAVIELKETIKKGIPVEISIVNGNLTAALENDPGARRDG